MNKTYFSSLMVTLAAMLLLTAPPAAAQKKPAPAVVMPAAGIESIGKGDKEFGIFANYTTFDDQDIDTFLLGASLGKFLSDSLEFRITPVVVYNKTTTPGPSPSSSSTFVFAPFFSLEKLFRGAANRNPVVPFIGGGIGITLGYTDGSTSDQSTYGIFVAPTGGVKVFLSERASLELALTYQVGVISVYDSAAADSFSGDIETLRQDVRFNFYY